MGLPKCPHYQGAPFTEVPQRRGSTVPRSGPKIWVSQEFLSFFDDIRSKSRVAAKNFEFEYFYIIYRALGTQVSRKFFADFSDFQHIFGKIQRFN